MSFASSTFISEHETDATSDQSAENKTEILSSLEWGFLHNGIFCILNASLHLHHSLQSPTYSKDKL
ncbi:hypothetical protein T09_3478 [Trichinella sp. T9]|nr:hypothetical protein T09_3478 [Trichinella sp. T9]